MSSAGPPPCTPCALACRRAQAAPGSLSGECSSVRCRLSRRALVGPVGPAPVAPGSPVRPPGAVRVRSSKRLSVPALVASLPAQSPPLFVTPPAGVSAEQPSRQPGAGCHAACGGLTSPPYQSLRSLGGDGPGSRPERRPWSRLTARAESTTRVPAVPGHAPRQRSSAALRPVVTPHGVVPATGWLSPAPPGPPRVVGGPIARLRERRPHRPPTPGF